MTIQISIVLAFLGGIFSTGAFADDSNSIAVLRVADVNGDGVVDQEDIEIIRNHVGSREADVYTAGRIYDANHDYHPLYDLNADGKIDDEDLKIVAREVGADVPEMETQIAQTTLATMKYYGPEGLQRARQDGYVASVPDSMGNGVHWVHLNRLLKWEFGGKFDADEPEGLLYSVDGKLAAVFYVKPVQFIPTRENFYNLVASEDHAPEVSFGDLPVSAWHDHMNVCATGIGSVTDPKDPRLTFDQDLEGVVTMGLTDQKSESQACAAQRGFISVRQALEFMTDHEALFAQGSTAPKWLREIMEWPAHFLKHLWGSEFMDRLSIPNVWPFSDVFFLPKAYMLHGWFHVTNPDGRFALSNMRVSPNAPELPSRHPRDGEHGGHHREM